MAGEELLKRLHELGTSNLSFQGLLPYGEFIFADRFGANQGAILESYQRSFNVIMSATLQGFTEEDIQIIASCELNLSHWYAPTVALLCQKFEELVEARKLVIIQSLKDKRKKSSSKKISRSTWIGFLGTVFVGGVCTYIAYRCKNAKF